MGNNLFCAIDLQNDFISGSLGSEKAIELAKRVPSFLNIVEESENNYIIFTKDTHFADTYAETQEGRKLPIPHCIEYEDGWKIPDDIYFSNKEPGKCRGKVVEKNTFGSIEFAGIVESYDDDYTIDKIFLFGLCTDICVVSNALLLKTICPETEIYCISDLSEATSDEAQKATLKVMNSCQVNIVTSAEVLEMLKE